MEIVILQSCREKKKKTMADKPGMTVRSFTKFQQKLLCLIVPLQ